MGTLKIELDLPEFKDKLDVSIIIKKDGTIVPPSIKKDEGIFNPNTTTPNIPNFRDPYTWDKKLEIRDPMPGEGMEIRDPVPDKWNTTQCSRINTTESIDLENQSNGIVDSMINGNW